MIATRLGANLTAEATWVVKLGGSLAASAELPAWLAVLAGAPARRVVIVPGGGPFADRVREAQRLQAFPDAAAHRMAILAMEQFGLMLCALAPGLRPAATPGRMRRALEEGETPVWMPARMTAERADIPPSWDVTSDSLAAWLAGRLGAEMLVLVKPVPPPARRGGATVGLADVGRAGVVDRAFADFVRDADFTVRWAAAGEHGAMAGALRGGALPGVGVRLPARVQAGAPGR